MREKFSKIILNYDLSEIDKNFKYDMAVTLKMLPQNVFQKFRNFKLGETEHILKSIFL